MTGATVKTGLKDGYGSAKDNILAGMKDGGAAALKPPKPALKDTGKLRKQLTAMKDGGAVKNKVNGGDKLAQDTEKQSKGLTAKQNIMHGMKDGGGTSDAEGLRAVQSVSQGGRGAAGVAALRLGQASARAIHRRRLGMSQEERRKASVNGVLKEQSYDDLLRQETQKAYDAIVRSGGGTDTSPKASSSRAGSGTPTP